jgi:hypothetical protein
MGREGQQVDLLVHAPSSASCRLDAHPIHDKRITTSVVQSLTIDPPPASMVC